jgi:UDP-3-O-[3-hydroxymyristoyl] N-acetylglucosamine deacetylase
MASRIGSARAPTLMAKEWPLGSGPTACLKVAVAENGRDAGMKAGRQTTLRKRTSVSGVGVHSGVPVTLTLSPADADCGVVFVRNGANGEPEREMRATAESVTSTDLATVLGDESGAFVSTVEHVMAALCGLGVDNCTVEIDGPEAPIMDGSAAAYVAAIDQAGIALLPAARRYFKILKPVRAVRGNAFGEFRPYERGFRLDVEIEFDHPLVGRQSLGLDVEPAAFRREVARARTFGFMRDVSRLWGAGYALGATLENTVVVADDRILNPEGLRFRDEFVRHKLLDAVGDLALAGAPILGAYRSMRGGHKLNHAVLAALLSDPTAWAIVEQRPPARPLPSHVEAGMPRNASAVAATP